MIGNKPSVILSLAHFQTGRDLNQIFFSTVINLPVQVCFQSQFSLAVKWTLRYTSKEYLFPTEPDAHF